MMNTLLRSSLALLAVGAALCAGCSPDADGEPQAPYESAGESHSITITNQSQFTLDAIYVHSMGGSYEDEGSKRVARDLDANESIELNAFTSGSDVTFVRERPDGRPIAVTTSDPVYVDASGYTLLLFDDSFRVLAPDP